MGKLDNKVAIITGAGSGIGEEIARVFAKEGAAVVVADISDEGGMQTVNMIREAGGVAMYIHTDVSIEQDIINMVNKTVASFGKLHILVNNAGIMVKEERTTDLSLDTWNKILSVNLTGPFLCCKYCIPEMLKVKSAAIVNISSRAGLYISPRIAYGATKAALISITKSVAIQYADCIRSNVICCGAIDTPVTAKLRAGGFNPKQTTQMIQRRGKPSDIAAAALFLASDDTSFVTAAVYPVDGGVLGSTLSPDTLADIERHSQL